MKENPGKSPHESFVETNHLVLPSDANILGNVFGGVMMSWIDMAAGISARRHSGCVSVTASVDALYFLAPAKVGNCVCSRAKVVYTGRTSMIVAVDVTTQNIEGGEPPKRCVTAYLSMVAINSEGHPTPVPPLILETEEDKRRCQEAAERRKFLLSRLEKEKDTP